MSRCRFPFLLVAIASLPVAAGTPINVGNRVWNDVNGNGIQDTGEPGLAGVTVQLWNNPRNMLLDSTTTSAMGIYTLETPGPGDFRIRVLLPSSDDVFSPKNAGSDDQLDSDINPTGTLFGFSDTISLASNVISTTIWDAGIVRAPIAVGNRVWNDHDEDGIQDPGEPGLGLTVVELWDVAKSAIFDSDTTDSVGAYVLLAPGPGSYRIRVVKPSTAAYSPKDAGGSDMLDSDVNPIGVDAGYTDALPVSEPTTAIDGGIVPGRINVGNRVWDDLDGDGVQEANEPGVSNVVVQLWNDTRTQLLASSISGANGTYVMQAPGPGSYRVRVVLATAEDDFSPKDAGGNDLTDSDINPAGPLGGFTDIYIFASNLISITTIDAGISVSRIFRGGFE